MSARRDWPAVVAGSIRAASGVSFLLSPQAANRLWGGEADETPTAQLLLRSMGYRDALVGGMLLRAGLTGSPTIPGWFLASGGADLADFVGGLATHEHMSRDQKVRGIGGAVVGIAVGIGGALLARRRLTT
jgi:hypothetical protein